MREDEAARAFGGSDRRVGPAMSHLTGRLLGSAYRVGARIGEGGMGAVYEAVHERLGRHVAVKVLHAKADLSADALARFEREARAAAALQHPGIVQVTDFQANPGEPPFLVMERLVGESLRERIGREGRVDPGQVCFVVSQVLDALETAHRAGIIHRDIKPDNVHLTNVGSGVAVAKVLDFGIAKLKNEAPLTQNGAMLGSPAYMPPEQALGQPLDARADVYGVGALAYHAISGKLPIDERAPITDVLRAIVEGAPPPLDALVPGLPPGLSALVARAMAKRAEDRFASAADMLAAIRPFVRVGPQAVDPARPSGLASTTSAPPLQGGHYPVYPAGGGLPPAPRTGPPPGFGPPGGPPPMGPPPGSGPPGGPPPAPRGAPHGPPPGAPLAHAGGASGVSAPRPPASGKSSAGLWIVGGLGAALVVSLGVGIVLFARDRPDVPAAPSSSAATAATVKASAPGATVAASAYGSPSASASSPSSVPRTPLGVLPKSVDAGRPSGVVDPPPSPVAPVAPVVPVADAGPPRRVAHSVRRTGMDLGPFGSGTQAADAVTAQEASFRACAPLACIGEDKLREDYQFLDSNYYLTVDDAGRVIGVRAANSLRNATVACPALDACMLPKVRAIPFPKPEGTERKARLSLMFRE